MVLITMKYTLDADPADGIVGSAPFDGAEVTVLATNVPVGTGVSLGPGVADGPGPGVADGPGVAETLGVADGPGVGVFIIVGVGVKVKVGVGGGGTVGVMFEEQVLDPLAVSLLPQSFTARTEHSY